LSSHWQIIVSIAQDWVIDFSNGWKLSFSGPKCVSCDLWKVEDFRDCLILVQFQKCSIFPLACAMSQVTHIAQSVNHAPMDTSTQSIMRQWVNMVRRDACAALP
jgi:hypothetical protein